MESEHLSRETEAARPSRLSMLMAFSLLSGGAIAGAAWASWLGESDPAPTVVYVEPPTAELAQPVQPEVVVVEPECPAPPPPQVVMVPTAPEKTFGTGTCPGRDAPSDSKAGQPFASDSDDQRTLDGLQLVGVAASPTRHGHLAVWTRDKVFFSDSDGRRFHEILAGPGEVYDVAIDCRGRAFALRGSERGFSLGLASAEAQAWRPVDLRDVDYDSDEPRDPENREYGSVDLQALGGWLVITAPPYWFGMRERDGHSAIAVSGDGGASWSYPAIPEAGFVETADVMSVDSRGRLRLLGYEGDCMYDGTALHTLALPAGKPVSKQQLSTDYQTRVTMTSRWGYDTRSCDGGLCALDLRNVAKLGADDYHDGNLAWRPVSGLPAPKAGNAEDADPDATEQPEPAVYENGRVYARLGRHILRLRGAKATLLADDIPPEVSFVQMDSSFRLLGLSTEGQLVRWSKRRGLRALRGQPVGH